jgi:hypothetical protein
MYCDMVELTLSTAQSVCATYGLLTIFSYICSRLPLNLDQCSTGRLRQSFRVQFSAQTYTFLSNSVAIFVFSVMTCPFFVIFHGVVDKCWCPLNAILLVNYMYTHNQPVICMGENSSNACRSISICNLVVCSASSVLCMNLYWSVQYDVNINLFDVTNHWFCWLFVE